MHLTIVSRMSPLAMWQAEHVRAQLIQHHPQLTIEIKGIKTQGDRQLDQPLYKVGGKSLFVKELEQALLAGEADIAVHSLKDLPAAFPSGLMLGAICAREDPRDAWICPSGQSWENLPAGARVGTSSLRRMVQLQRLRPDLNCFSLRGNVDSRLRKCQQGEWDAIILAVAGLIRLQQRAQVQSIFTPAQLLPAVGQGALGIECRQDDEHTRGLIAVLDHAPTQVCIRAERAMNAALGGNCQIPVAGFAQIIHDQVHLMGRVGHPKTLALVEAQKIGSTTDPESLGKAVAQDLIAQGAQHMIADLL